LENRKGDGMGGCFVAPLEEFVAIVKKTTEAQILIANLSKDTQI